MNLITPGLSNLNEMQISSFLKIWWSLHVQRLLDALIISHLDRLLPTRILAMNIHR